ELRAAGLDPASLPWLDPPPEGALQSAARLLERIGALDAQGQATAIGRDCARLPLHPRLARLVVETARRGHRAAGCAAAAFLSTATRAEAIRRRPALPTSSTCSIAALR